MVSIWEITALFTSGENLLWNNQYKYDLSDQSCTRWERGNFLLCTHTAITYSEAAVNTAKTKDCTAVLEVINNMISSLCENSLSCSSLLVLNIIHTSHTDTGSQGYLISTKCYLLTQLHPVTLENCHTGQEVKAINSITRINSRMWDYKWMQLKALKQNSTHALV